MTGSINWPQPDHKRHQSADPTGFFILFENWQRKLQAEHVRSLHRFWISSHCVYSRRELSRSFVDELQLIKIIPKRKLVDLDDVLLNLWCACWWGGGGCGTLVHQRTAVIIITDIVTFCDDRA